MILKTSAASGSSSAACGHRARSTTAGSPRSAALRGRGKEVDHRIEQRLHALVLEGRAAQHRHQAPLIVPSRSPRRICSSLRLPPLRYSLRSSSEVSATASRSRSRCSSTSARYSSGTDSSRYSGAEALVEVAVGAQAHQVDDAHERLLTAERHLDRDRVGLEPGADLVDHAGEAGANAVHLVDEGDSGHPVAVGLPPNGLGTAARRRRPRRTRPPRRRAHAGCARPRR